EVIRSIADRVAVMDTGRVVESGVSRVERMRFLARVVSTRVRCRRQREQRAHGSWRSSARSPTASP
ncbi:methionine ABC transporter ATP-binding protein, partial [Corynebacterium diphtheriae]